MKKRTAIIIAVIILAYYIFTSGLVFELTGETKMDSLDTPYSIALSNYRIGFVGVFNEDDVNCAKWLAEKTSGDIWVDYNGMSLMIDYTEYTRGTYEKPKEHHYLLLHTWNNINEKMVYGWFEGAREYVALPDLTDYKEVYRVNEAVVYEYQS